MAQNVPLATGDPAVEAFFDATQEMLSGLAVNLVLELADAITVRVPAGPGHDQVSLSIGGQYRAVAAPVTRAHPGGLAGTYDIYATSPNNDPLTGAPPGGDLSFALAITPTGQAPAGVDRSRLLGRLTWDGAAITSVTQLVGSRPTGPAGGDLAGTYPAPTVGPFPADRVLSWGGDTNLYRSAANVLKTDDDFHIGGQFGANIGLATQVAFVSGAGRPEIAFGSGLDVNLYRAALDVLKTDDHMRSAVGFMVDAASGQIAFRAVQGAGSGLLYNYLAGADANPAFAVLGNGRMDWGAGGLSAPDTNLYRSTANELKTDDAFRVAGALWPDAGIELHSASGQTPGIHLRESSTGSDWFIREIVGAALELATEGAGAQRAVFTAGGQLQLPLAGANAGLLLGGDANLYRAATDQLKTDDRFTVARVGGADTALDVGIAGEVQPRAYFRADGGLQWGAGGGAVADVNLYRATADVLQTDDTFKASALHAQPGLSTMVAIGPVGGLAGIEFGAAQDVNIRRVQAGLLRTTDSLQLAGGGLYAQGGVENLRTLRGTVNADGTIAAGSGFSSSFDGSRYVITFSAAFAGVPSVVASRLTGTPGRIEPWSASTTGVYIYTWDSGGTGGAKGPFSFTAVGPR